jgi:hypothetical protein
MLAAVVVLVTAEQHRAELVAVAMVELVDLQLQQMEQPTQAVVVAGKI